MDEDLAELVSLLEGVEGEAVAALYYVLKKEYTSARLCAEDACNLLADFITAVKELE